MVQSVRSRARPFRVAASIIMVLFVLGVTSPSYADPGSNGKGAENSNAAANSNAGGNGNGADNGKAVGKSDSGSTTPSTGGSSGDANAGSVPQPISNADANKGGANGQCPGGPYCSTPDGASENGNGGGKAVGKPCAGCVGKADNKNPKGQLPNAKHDGNRGYECDKNNGIGKGNPAHTGCKKQVTPPKPPVPPTTPEPPKPPPVQPEQPEKPPVVPPAEQPEKEAEKEKEAAPEAKGQVPRPPAAAPAPAAPAAVPPAAVGPAQNVLPPTGASPWQTGLAVGGAALLLAGSVILLRRRMT